MITGLPSIFAFWFATPWFLAGTALASAPIIIHLLNRRRFKRLDWAAMKFLLRAEELNRRRIRVEQLLLLIIRTLLVLLFVLALARPYLSGAIGGGGLGEPVHRIIVVDTSYSMQYSTGQETTLDRAVGHALSIIEQSGGTDEVSLVLMSAPAELVHKKSASPHMETVRNDLLRTAVPMQTTADGVDALSAVKEAIDTSQIRHKEVYVISDMQARTFRPEGSPEARQRITQLFREIGEQCNLTIVDVAQGTAKNLAVADWRLTDAVVWPGQPATFEATVVNHGTAPEAVTVQMQVDDEPPTGGRTIQCPVGEPQAVTFRYTFQNSGTHAVRARLAYNDPLPLDNERYLAVEVKPHVDVLLINGEPDRDGRAKYEETYYLRIALQPSQLANRVSPYEPRVVTATDLATADLEPFPCVMLANVKGFSPEAARRLRRYVADGGNLIIFLGDNVEADSYNQQLYANGRGILPAALGGRIAHDGTEEDPLVGFDPLNYRDPIVAPFQGLPEAGLLSTKTARYYQLTLSPADRQAGARVVLAFNDGRTSPAVLVKPHPAGTGHVALVATSADKEWTDWPARPSYPSVLHLLTRDLIKDRTRLAPLQVGQALSLKVPASLAGRKAWLVPPGETRRREELAITLPADGADRALVQYGQTGQAGLYRVGVDGTDPPVRHLYAVNVDASEADLAGLDRAEVRQMMGTDVYNYVPGNQEIDTEALEAAVGTDLYQYFFLMVLVLVVLESILAWRFGHWTEAA